MGFFRGAGVFFLSFMLVISLIIISITFTLNNFLYPPIYIAAFEQGGVYDYISDNLENAQVATFIAIPSEGPKPIIEGLLSNFLAYLRSDTDILNITVRVDTEKLRNFFISSFENVPTCAPNHNPFSQDNPCLPAGKTADQFLDEFLAKKNLSFFDNDIVDLADIYGIESGSEGRKTLETAREYIQYYQTAKVVGVILGLLIIFLLYLIQRKESLSFCRTIAISLFISALFLLSLVFLTNNLLYEVNFLDPTIESIVQSGASMLKYKLVLYSVIMLAVSIGLIALSLVKKETVTNNYK